MAAGSGRRDRPQKGFWRLPAHKGGGHWMATGQSQGKGALTEKGDKGPGWG